MKEGRVERMRGVVKKGPSCRGMKRIEEMKLFAVSSYATISFVVVHLVVVVVFVVQSTSDNRVLIGAPMEVVDLLVGKKVLNIVFDFAVVDDDDVVIAGLYVVVGSLVDIVK